MRASKVLILLALALLQSVGLVGCMTAPAGSSNPAEGAWNWPNGGVVHIAADFTMTHVDGLDILDAGTWEAFPGPGTRVRLTWSSGWIDTLTLSADGKTLEGPNQNGDIITGTR
jgi:hypothetical protein